MKWRACERTHVPGFSLRRKTGELGGQVFEMCEEARLEMLLEKVHESDTHGLCGLIPHVQTLSHALAQPGTCAETCPRFESCTWRAPRSNAVGQAAPAGDLLQSYPQV